MNPLNTEIVVSTYNQSVPWISNFTDRGYNVRVYDHANPLAKYNIEDNVGQEASVYIKYIIDSYKSLSNHTIFLHNHDFSWHQRGSIVDLVNEQIAISKSETSYPKFYNINNRCCRSILGNEPVMSWFDAYLGPYIGNHTLYDDFTFGKKCCAQFVIAKERIIQYPRSMYLKLYTWILNTEKSISATYMEWTWDLLFDNPFWNKQMTFKQYIKDRKKAKDPSSDYTQCKLI